MAEPVSATPVPPMKRLGIFFFYDNEGVADGYIFYFLEGLRQNCHEIAVVCNGNLTGESRKQFEKIASRVIVRENTGLDVWAYRTGLLAYGWDELRQFDEIVLCNFTAYGPIYPFSEMFDAMAVREVDFWGITQFHYLPYDPMGTVKCNYIPDHIQSNFIVVRRSLFDSPEYHRFWEDMPPITSYQESIGRYEAVFTKIFADLGYKWDVYVRTDDLKDVANQPLLTCAPELIRNRRCPIMKRRMFFHDYYDTIGGTDGRQCRVALEYVARHTDYDTNLVWDNLLRTCSMAELKRTMHLNFILPKEVSAGRPKSRMALIFHLYFGDQIDFCAGYIANLPKGTDIYVATSSEKNKAEIEKKFAGLTGGKLQVVVSQQNRGRDLPTLLIEFRDVVPHYDLICFAHDKKAGQVTPQSIGMAFRDKCFENMLGSPQLVENIIRTFEENPRLGLLMPPYPVHGKYFFILKRAWTSNFGKTFELAQMLGLHALPDFFREPIAPFGSFFWFRPAAYKTMLGYPWKYEDFPEEPVDEDGTIMHALERLRPYAVQHDGFYSAWLLSDDYARDELENYHFMLRELILAVDIDTMRFLDLILRIRYLQGQYQIFSKSWAKTMGGRYIPEKLHPIAKRIYQRLRSLRLRH
ncbi:MAG: rhamnan synthesis protein F [Lentisphaeria bacterium]|nr:rhamnan synthesis protein F [Lentisphaeria bacterium]